MIINRNLEQTELGRVAGNTPGQCRRARLAVAARAYDPADAATLLAALGLDDEHSSDRLSGSHSDETPPPVGRGTPATPKRHTDDWTRTRKVG
jgi:hypothetical protein